MKAVIFDIDDTLISWLPKYYNLIVKLLKNSGYSEEEAQKIFKSIDKYILNSRLLNKKDILKFINDELGINITMKLLDDYIDLYSNCADLEDGVKETLEYLSKKYDLYVITDWFTESQTKRLEKIGLAKYFKKIYGADINYFKSNISAYDVILKKYKPEECVMIGDALELDIIPPLTLGMKAIWKTDKKSKDYQTIKNISELRNIL